MNNRAESGQPRWTPLDMLIFSVNHPFILTQLLIFEYRVETHFLNPKMYRHSLRKFQLRQSKAFLKSDSSAIPLNE